MNLREYCLIWQMNSMHVEGKYILEFMDPDERREVLEEAGLDLDEFDF